MLVYVAGGDSYLLQWESLRMSESLELTESEIAACRLLKVCAPFRDWHVVKWPGSEAVRVDSWRKAVGLARRHDGARVWRVELDPAPSASGN